MRKPDRQMRAWLALLISAGCCILPFVLLPYLLYWMPEFALEMGLLVLLWIVCPVLSLLMPAWAARRGVPAILACVLPALGYLGLLLQRMTPVPWVLAASLVVSIVSASYGQERRRRAEKSAVARSVSASIMKRPSKKRK